jgi:LPXTG-motif cell wall-anchored protein
MRVFVRLGAVAAGGVLALAVAAPAYAAEVDSDLNQTNVTADDPDFDQGFGECSEVPDQGENQDVWVFVWPGNEVTALISLALEFDTDGDGSADTTITEADATETDDEGTFKAWVTTPAGWTLVSGTSTVEDADGELPGMGEFQLTHTCAGRPGEEPSPSPSPSETPPGETPPGETPPGETPPGEDDEKPGLPVTGLQTGGLVALGVALLAGGAAMLVVRRRRDLAGLMGADE